jgi:hypothetical protein
MPPRACLREIRDTNPLTAAALPDLGLKSTKFCTIFFKMLDFTPRFLYTGKQAAFLKFGP